MPGRRRGCSCDEAVRISLPLRPPETAPGHRITTSVAPLMVAGAPHPFSPETLHNLDPLFCRITEVRPSRCSRGSPFAAALACGSESASWLVSRGPRPFQQLFPLGLSMPISTWARCSAHAPRAAFKQWSFEQHGAAKVSAAPPRPTDHVHQHPSISQSPLCNKPGVSSLVLPGPPKFRRRARSRCFVGGPH